MKTCIAPADFNCLETSCFECRYEVEEKEESKNVNPPYLSLVPEFMKDKEITKPKFHGHPDFYKILDELKELHSKKNQDYAGNDPLSNLKETEDMGIPAWKGVAIRLSDKYSRLKTFVKKEQYEVKDESVEDVFRDMAVYAILGLILYRESKKDDIPF